MRASLLAAMLLACGSGPVLAHAILVGSDPPSQGEVTAGTVKLALRYNSRVDHARSSLVLTRPDAGTERLPIAPGSGPATLDSVATLAPGSYSLRWQVLATDGHITRGDVPFSVLPAKAPVQAPAGVASPPATASTAAALAGH